MTNKYTANNNPNDVKPTIDAVGGWRWAGETWHGQTPTTLVQQTELQISAQSFIHVEHAPARLQLGACAERVAALTLASVVRTHS
jgi:hypothetical protein